MITATATFTKADIGCYFDGARGWEDIGDAILSMAATYGWKRTPLNSDSTWDDWYDLITEAEDYLNTLTDDDVYFGSNESGDWGLWHICDDLRDDNCDFCAEAYWS